jgi:hypothetical protein
MEKTYTKDGYSFVDKNNKVVIVSRDTVVKAISDNQKLFDNVANNLEKLNADLLAIDTLK